ncbi:Uncharacterised protein [Plesiomonas shigelloides]|uniref:hypothetical protein n=1 Tax=Plesiomonas shigelloides TaxID=703 RepID=UPI000E0640AF|nr:hypothetical protein [Plesiomonas shigelloides]SUB63518.1 Uncharacterised protein [Plesiomonas shigelloides]SUB63522.1 Uncharacterised protein [Plesiomonas shigelloides]
MQLESCFKKFLTEVMKGTDLDLLPESRFKSNKSDFYISEINSIIEIKSISSDRYDALEPWLNNKIKNNLELKNGMPIIFGTIPFKTIFESHSNQALFTKQLDQLANRTIEDYIRNAKKQIHSTKLALNKQSASGFLVILNESYEFYDTAFVYRSVQKRLAKIIEKSPSLKIDGVIYINESHKYNNIVDVCFIHESDDIENIEYNETLVNIGSQWAMYRGYPHIKCTTTDF